MSPGREECDDDGDESLLSCGLEQRDLVTTQERKAMQ